MTYEEINKEMAINEGYRDLALAVLQNGCLDYTRETDPYADPEIAGTLTAEDFYYSETGKLWRQIYTEFDEGVQGLTTDSPLGHVTNQYFD
jgi:hypothetical protein